MKCKLCGDADPDCLVILPIQQKDGSLCIMACLSCARKSDAYCKRHRMPHLGFSDKTTACPRCIELLVKKHAFQAEHIADRLTRMLPSDEDENLHEFAEIGAALSGQSQAMAILRAIASKAMRTDSSINAVVDRMIADGSAAHVLWH